MSIGLTRLFYQLQELGLVEEEKSSKIDFLILPMDKEYHFYAIDVLHKLKDQGKKADIFLEDGKFKKKINYADKINAKYAVIIGEEEVSKNQVSIKNMESGEQFNKNIEELDF